MHNKHSWKYNGKDVIFSDVSNYFGFVYEITNLVDGRKYIGRKYLWSFRKLKGSKRKKKIPSNWKTYWGSCNELKDDIKKLGKNNFKREILMFYVSKSGVNYNEVKLLFDNDVLNKKDKDGNYVYYNSNISGRYFRGIDYEK